MTCRAPSGTGLPPLLARLLGGIHSMVVQHGWAPDGVVMPCEDIDQLRVELLDVDPHHGFHGSCVCCGILFVLSVAVVAESAKASAQTAHRFHRLH